MTFIYSISNPKCHPTWPIFMGSQLMLLCYFDRIREVPKPSGFGVQNTSRQHFVLQLGATFRAQRMLADASDALMVVVPDFRYRNSIGIITGSKIETKRSWLQNVVMSLNNLRVSPKVGEENKKHMFVESSDFWTYQIWQFRNRFQPSSSSSALHIIAVGGASTFARGPEWKAVVHCGSSWLSTVHTGSLQQVSQVWPGFPDFPSDPVGHCSYMELSAFKPLIIC